LKRDCRGLHKDQKRNKNAEVGGAGGPSLRVVLIQKPRRVPRQVQPIRLTSVVPLTFLTSALTGPMNYSLLLSFVFVVYVSIFRSLKLLFTWVELSRRYLDLNLNFSVQNLP